MVQKQIEWKEYLVKQAKLHPAMEPKDLYKLIYQAVYGAEHLLQDVEAAHAYFQTEFEAVSAEEELLYEQIAEKVYRINLRAWKKRNLPAEWLFRMFVGSVAVQTKADEAKRKREQQRIFSEYVEIASEAVKEEIFSFSYEEFLQYKNEYAEDDPRPVHHSARYREAERSAYRLVRGEYLRVLSVLEAMENKKFIISIDGRCASGKSTMAQILSEITGAGVVHMDDFFLPVELRTEVRLAQPGGNVHYERFQEEVLPFLKSGEAFAYSRFDCSRMKLGEKRLVPKAPFCIVEGAYSSHPIFGDYADLKVFSDIEPEEQLKRIGNRDGEEMLATFREHWIPMEENYFSSYQVRENADIIV